MLWKDISNQYSDSWLVIEAINAESKNGQRKVSEASLVELYKESIDALKKYKQLHKENPNKELYVVYSGWKEILIDEMKYAGFRGKY